MAQGVLSVAAVAALAVGLLAGCSREPPQPMLMYMLTPVAPPPPGVYTVRSGGTLAAVARRTGASLADLQALNPTIAANQKLSAGHRLWLPFAWPE